MNIPSLVSAFQEHVGRSMFRSLGEPIVDLGREFGDVYFSDFESHLHLLQSAFPAKPWPRWSADGFIRFSKQILREEASFRETGQYSAAPEDFDKITEAIYDNGAVMEGYYLVGLYCSYFIWPHHYQILSFFRDAFLRSGHAAPKTLAEWGVGHGLYSLLALQQWPGAKAVLADISRHSLSFSEALMAAAGCLDGCKPCLGDVMKSWDEWPVDRMICGEMLEHVPDPGKLLEQIRDGLNPNGLAYLTGAINAPQSDHVSLFRSEAELLRLAGENGFRVRRHLLVCHPNRRHDANPPQVLAMVAERAG